MNALALQHPALVAALLLTAANRFMTSASYAQLRTTQECTRPVAMGAGGSIFRG